MKEEHYVICQHCGDEVLSSNTFLINGRHVCLRHIVRYNTLIYCDKCKSYHDQRDICDAPIIGVQNYNFKRTWKRSDGQRSFGAEIEFVGVPERVINDDCNEGLLGNIILKYPEEFVIVHDGSLQGEGAEIVTRPRSLEEWENVIHEKDPLNILLTYLHRYYYISSNSLCGLHIHCGLETVSEDTVRKLQNFLLYSEEEELIIATMFDRAVGSMTRYAMPVKQRNHHYAAVNYNNNTVELRLFGGATTPEGILLKVKLYDALLKYCEEISETEAKKKDYFKYLQWLSNFNDPMIKTYGEALCALLF